MIWLIGGTSETRYLAKELKSAGYNFLVSVMTKQGIDLAKEDAQKILVGALSNSEIKELLIKEKINLVIDSSHPHAAIISKYAQDNCNHLNIPYIRYERPKTIIPNHPSIIKATDIYQASREAFANGNNIFSTIGIKGLPVLIAQRDKLIQEEKRELRVLAKILPQEESIAQCRELGLTLKDIFAVSGVFSKELYGMLIKEYNIDVLISKESGQSGGTSEKIRASLAMGKKIIIIERPLVDYHGVVDNFEELLKKISDTEKNIFRRSKDEKRYYCR